MSRQKFEFFLNPYKEMSLPMFPAILISNEEEECMMIPGNCGCETCDMFTREMQRLPMGTIQKKMCVDGFTKQIYYSWYDTRPKSAKSTLLKATSSLCETVSGFCGCITCDLYQTYAKKIWKNEDEIYSKFICHFKPMNLDSEYISYEWKYEEAEKALDILR